MVQMENRNTNFLYGQPDGGPTHDAPQNGYLNRSRVSLDYIPRDNNHPYRSGYHFPHGRSLSKLC